MFTAKIIEKRLTSVQIIFNTATAVSFASKHVRSKVLIRLLRKKFKLKKIEKVKLNSVVTSNGA